MDWSHWGPDDRSSRLVEQAPVEALSLLLRVGSSQWPLLPGEVLGFGSSPPAILRFFHVGTYLLLVLQKTPVPRLFKSLAYVFWSILNWISWCWLSFYRFQGFPGSHHGSRIWIPQRRVFQLVPLKSSRNATSWDPILRIFPGLVFAGEGSQGLLGWWTHGRAIVHWIAASWVVVSNIFHFHPYLGTWSNLTNFFQMGWNHELD